MFTMFTIAVTIVFIIVIETECYFFNYSKIGYRRYCYRRNNLYNSGTIY